MSQKRLFIGNLPDDITEDELSIEFAAYGEVKAVELKSKTNAFDEVTKFAFISMLIGDRDLNVCIQEFKDQKYKGKFLSVSLAKESFLDRLKREREEAGLSVLQINGNSNKHESKPTQPRKSNKEFQNAIQAAKFDNDKSSSSDESTEDEDTPKTKTFNVNENVHKNTKAEVKTQTSKSDQQRTESLQKMAEEYKQKKMAIQSALSNFGAAKNRIVFDDGQQNGSPETKKKKQTLFDEGEEDDGNNYRNDFQIKQQFEGEKGQKLLELQTRYKNDSRFQIDDRFKDEDQLDNDEEEGEQEQDEGEHERKWQMAILENVVGKKFQPRDTQNESTRNKLMTRFDPSREDHNAFLVNSTNKTNGAFPDKDSKKKKKAEMLKEKPKIEEIEVSKETYYKISDNITDIFKPSTEGFSLLSMFGAGEDQDATKSSSYQEILQSTASKKNERNPFRYDSSDSEDEIADLPTKESIMTRKKNQQDKNEIAHETLFLIDDDPRLLEGALFFRVVEKGEDAPDLDDCRRDLKKIVKKQMIRSYKKVGKMFKRNKKSKFY